MKLRTMSCKHFKRKKQRRFQVLYRRNPTTTRLKSRNVVKNNLQKNARIDSHLFPTPPAEVLADSAAFCSGLAPLFSKLFSREFVFKTRRRARPCQPHSLNCQQSSCAMPDQRISPTTRRFHRQPATRSSLFRAAQAIPTRAPSSNDLVRSVTNSSTILPESPDRAVRKFGASQGIV